MRKKVKDAFTATEVGTLIEDFQSQFRVFDDGLKTIGRKVDSIDETVGRAWVKITGIDIRLIRVENRLENVENRLGNVENRLENVENRLGNVENRLDGIAKDVKEIKDTGRNHDDRISRLEEISPK